VSVFKRLKHAVMQNSRERKLDDFYSRFKEGMSVLDVGVSAEHRDRHPLENYFLKQFRYASNYYTGLGVQDLRSMSALYPGKTFVSYSGGRFPFRDQEFDFVHSNAVIEHVGDDDAQLLFINEMVRVAKVAYFTTPNKYFPIEAHTNIVLMHWNNALFYWWCARTKRNKRKDNLYLFSYHRLLSLLKRSRVTQYEVSKNRLCGVPMTFTVVCSASA